MISLRDELSRFKAQDTFVLAASVQDLESHRRFAEEENLNFPLLADTGRHLSFLYGVTDKLDGLSQRVTFFIDKEGIIRLIDRKVNAPTHGDDLANRLEDLLN